MKNDGGPAFPHNFRDGYGKGMSLRDYFAGQALTGFHIFPKSNKEDITTIVRVAYDVADAMLEAREK